jgi:hypothetical protein
MIINKLKKIDNKKEYSGDVDNFKKARKIWNSYH